jgi:hypothetical protein
MKRRTVVRIAAVAVATATVVTGLVDVSAAAATTASGGSEVSVSGRTPVVVASESDRLVGPLAMMQNDTTAFGLRADADTMRTTAAGTIAEAQSLADDWSVPTVGQTGPVHGVGAKADRCMTKRSPGNASLDTEPCTGSPQQDWTWTDTTSRQGFTKALSPVTATHRAIAPRGAGTFVHVIDSAGSKRPMVLDDAMKAEREITAVAAVDAVDRSAVVSGVASTGSTVSIGGESLVVDDTGVYTLTLTDLEVGTTSVAVTQTLPSGEVHGTAALDIEVAAASGQFAAVELPSTEIPRGRDSAATAQVETTAELTTMDSTLTLTAPAGATVASADDRSVAYLRPGDDHWRESASLRLTRGVLSPDATSVTYDADTTSSGFRLPAGSRLRFGSEIRVPFGSADHGALGFVHSGTADNGSFHVFGRAAVSFVDRFRDATLDNLADRDRFTPGEVEFTGSGFPGATVTITPASGGPVSTEVRPDGTWRAVRYLGNAAYTLSVSHTSSEGENTLEPIRLFSSDVAEGGFTLTSPSHGDGHAAPGWVTFSGTGTTWSRVSIADESEIAPTTATVQYDGSWTARRWVGIEPTTFTVTSSRADGENGSETVAFNTGVSDRPFTLDSHADGGAFTPGLITFSGTGSTGDTVTLTAPGLAPLEARVDVTGRWSLQRWLGNGSIAFAVKHTTTGGESSEQQLRLYSDQVPQGELVVSTPIDGDGHAQAGWVTFTGTGTTWSRVAVDDGTGTPPSVATVQYDGSWTVRRWVGAGPVTVTISSARADVENGRHEIRLGVDR